MLYKIILPLLINHKILNVMTYFYRTIILLSSCILLFGCSQTSTDGLDLPDIVGSYEMQSIKDAGESYHLPFLLNETEPDTTVLIYRGGWLILKEDGSFEMKSDLQSTFYDNGNIKSSIYRKYYGSYTHDQDSIYLQPNSYFSDIYEPTSGTLRNNEGNFYIRVSPFSEQVRFTFEEMSIGKYKNAQEESNNSIPYYKLPNKEDFLFIPEITNENTLIQIMEE